MIDKFYNHKMELAAYHIRKNITKTVEYLMQNYDTLTNQIVLDLENHPFDNDSDSIEVTYVHYDSLGISIHITDGTTHHYCVVWNYDKDYDECVWLSEPEPYRAITGKKDKPYGKGHQYLGRISMYIHKEA